MQTHKIDNCTKGKSNRLIVTYDADKGADSFTDINNETTNVGKKKCML